MAETSRVLIDQKLNAKEHIKAICKKRKKLNALKRLSFLIASYQLRLIHNSFIYGQFNFCSPMGLFSSKRVNNLVNKIHERMVRLIRNDYENRFNGLLEINNEVTFHVKKKTKKKQMTRVYECANGLSNSITNEIFSKRNIDHNLIN